VLDTKKITLSIDYTVDIIKKKHLSKINKLQTRINKLLQTNKLGSCNTYSIGNGKMSVCPTVSDYKLAKSVIKEDLEGSEFNDYVKIYKDA
jgi:hypothetical protein